MRDGLIEVMEEGRWVDSGDVRRGMWVDRGDVRRLVDKGDVRWVD